MLPWREAPQGLAGARAAYENKRADAQGAEEDCRRQEGREGPEVILAVQVHWKNFV